MSKKKWCLTHPRPIHFKLAELTALGLSRQEAARLTGLSIWQISRIRNSPLFSEMVTQARRHLAEAQARAQLDPAAILNLETTNSIHTLATIRDFSGLPTLQLKAASTLLHAALERPAKPSAPSGPVQHKHVLVIPSTPQEESPC